jgi:hypothetical protein
MSDFDFGHWECKFADSIPEDTIGFLYKITEKSSSKYYYGIKQTVSKRTLPPLKGKKRKRKKIVESDWRTYTSSSGIIKESIEKNKDNYEFEILSFHDSKSSLKIAETKIILEHIFDENCYNECVNIRLRIPKGINKDKGE